MHRLIKIVRVIKDLVKPNAKNITAQNLSIVGLNNKVIVVENGKEKIITGKKISGLDIHISGNNNTVKIEMPVNFSNSSIVISESDNDYIHVKSSKYHVNNFHVNSRLHSNHSLFIDEDFYCNGASVFLRETGGNVKIGRDCMFASNIVIWTSDGHCIFDNDTKELLNKPVCGVSIGNHVWLGNSVNILKDSKIADNSVVALGGIVSKQFEEKNIIIGGVNKVLRRNINWSREFITDFKGGC